MGEVVLCLHVKTWTWAVAGINFVLTGINTINMVRELIGGAPLWNNAVGIGLQLIWFLFAILLVVALIKNKASFIVPHMVVSFIMGLIAVVQIVLAVIQGQGIVQIVISAITIILIVFFIAMEYKCYQWMKDYDSVHSTY